MARSRFNEPIEPMTLANMRENGVRSLAVTCWQCPHETVINADQWPGESAPGCAPVHQRCLAATSRNRCSRMSSRRKYFT
jgi:hypothetical protein